MSEMNTTLGDSHPEQGLRVAVSPCPNDTYIFGAWMLGLVEGAPAARFFWDDVQSLNQAAADGRYDVVKVSAVQGLSLTRQYAILSGGGAFGLHAGPKVVQRPQGGTVRRVAVPGLQTTAYALLRGAWPTPFEAVPLRYDTIPAAVQSGQVDAGVLIHESALVFQRYGLECVLDLGAWWATYSNGLPLPLGVILVSRQLPEISRQRIATSIQASLAHARAQPETIWPWVQTLAQEMDEGTLRAHIDAYVNDLSQDHASGGGDEALARLGGLLDVGVPNT